MPYKDEKKLVAAGSDISVALWDCEFSPDKNYKDTEYTKMIISITSDYKWGDGWADSKTLEKYGDPAIPAKKFREEVNKIFSDNGWKLELTNESGTCDVAYKGLSSIYIHPMELSGEIHKNDVNELLDMFKIGHDLAEGRPSEPYTKKSSPFETFSVNYVRLLNDLTGFGEAELVSYLEEHSSELEAEVVIRKDAGSIFRRPELAEKYGIFSFGLNLSQMNKKNGIHYEQGMPFFDNAAREVLHNISDEPGL